jgi:TetR/AcrR family transcriptional regulator
MRTKILNAKRDESVRRILDAAMEVFAEVGYEGARVDEIAKRAGVNKAMIYYRIGDKKTLYEQVLLYVFGDSMQRFAENISEDLSPEEKFKTYIANIAATMAQHPSFSRIMMREVASGWVNSSDEIVKHIAGVLINVNDIINDGVKKGVFHQVNPIVVHLMVIGAMLLCNLSTPVREQFDSALEGKVELSDIPIEDMIPELLLRALKAHP